MGEEFYSIIKLVSGEEIFAKVCVDENEGEPILLVQKPIKMKMIQTPEGAFIKVSSWMELTEEDVFVIRLDRIITMTETHDKKMIEVYDQYIEESEEEDLEPLRPRSKGKAKITGKMGYVASVEEAREMLEDIYSKDIKESQNVLFKPNKGILLIFEHLVKL